MEVVRASPERQTPHGYIIKGERNPVWKLYEVHPKGKRPTGAHHVGEKVADGHMVKKRGGRCVGDGFFMGIVHHRTGERTSGN